jgi:hypothetical protein
VIDRSAMLNACFGLLASTTAQQKSQTFVSGDVLLS